MGVMTELAPMPFLLANMLVLTAAMNLHLLTYMLWPEIKEFNQLEVNQYGTKMCSFMICI